MIPHIKMLVNQGHNVDVACNIQREIDKSLVELGCKVYDIRFSRSPLRKSNIKAYQDLKKLIVDQKYDLVHTHTPVASAIVRLVCKSIKSTKVIYTAHGFHFYTGAPIKNWLIYYPLEKWLSKHTDTLITINNEDYERAKSTFKAKRVEYIPGVGLDVNSIKNTSVDKLAKRQQLNIPIEAFILLSVGELNKNKNHETIIRALGYIDNSEIHYVICGKGQLEKHLKDLCVELGVEERVHLLGFREDIIEICKVSDTFVFPSNREGLSVALMEAMACGLPIVCSNIRGNNDLIEDGTNGYLVNKNIPQEYGECLTKLIDNRELIQQMRNLNLLKINEYALTTVLDRLKMIYSESGGEL
jgi:glycosyltransferase involved in cell wall biosynthesis